MIVGCGTSDLGAQLYKDGYHYITNVDFSKTLIDHMRDKHQQYDEMDCKFVLSLTIRRCLDGYYRAKRNR